MSIMRTSFPPNIEIAPASVVLICFDDIFLVAFERSMTLCAFDNKGLAFCTHREDYSVVIAWPLNYTR